MWPQTDLTQLFGVDLPIILAPMAGPGTAELAAAVSEAGGLGSLPCAMLSVDEIKTQTAVIRARTSKPFNLNFFCHTPPEANEAREAAWKVALHAYYLELGLDPDAPVPAANRAPFSAAHCELIEELRPPVVSFHFGLPDESLVRRVKAAGCIVLSSATTVEEALWLEARGVHVVIAQGYEAGGHRGMFLTDDLATQTGTMALVPMIVDAVRVPVIATGGIADGRGIAAAMALGASAAQIGTAYLSCPEAKVAPAYKDALATSGLTPTALTNVFTGRPARGLVNRAIRELGPVSEIAPAFPKAAAALAPLRAAAEKQGSGAFSPLWAGQAAALSRAMPAADLTRHLAEETGERLRHLSRH
jgi:nitronate monooxygenase